MIVLLGWIQKIPFSDFSSPMRLGGVSLHVNMCLWLFSIDIVCQIDLLSAKVVFPKFLEF